MFLLSCLLYIACNQSSWSLVFATSIVCAWSDLLTPSHQVGPRIPDLEPNVGFIYILHPCPVVASFISVATALFFGGYLLTCRVVLQS